MMDVARTGKRKCFSRPCATRPCQERPWVGSALIYSIRGGEHPAKSSISLTTDVTSGSPLTNSKQTGGIIPNPQRDRLNVPIVTDHMIVTGRVVTTFGSLL